MLKAGESQDVNWVLQVVRNHGPDFEARNLRTAFDSLGSAVQAMGEEEKGKLAQTTEFQSLVDMVVEGARLLSASDLAVVAAVCGRMKFQDDMLQDRLAQFMIRKIGDASAEDVVNMAIGFAQQGQSPSKVIFDAMREKVAPTLDRLSGESRKGLDGAFKAFGYHLK